MHDLPFQTPTQFAALALTLFAGWLLGLGSASGGAKWRERYEDEAGDHAGYRHQAETEFFGHARQHFIDLNLRLDAVIVHFQVEILRSEDVTKV